MPDIVVVDTSVFVAALKSRDGAAREVLRLCLQGELSPIMGHYDNNDNPASGR